MSKFFPLSMTLHALRHITEEQLLHASNEQIWELYRQLTRLLYAANARDINMTSRQMHTEAHSRSD